MSNTLPLNMSPRSAKRLWRQIPLFLGICTVCYIWKTFGPSSSDAAMLDTASPDAALSHSEDAARGRRLHDRSDSQNCLGACVSEFEQNRRDYIASEFIMINGASMLRYKDACQPEANYEKSTTSLATIKEEKMGWIVYYIFSIVYMFAALAIVCDEFFVPALECFVDEFGISMDVAGATFMAAGGSMPELFTSFIATFKESEVGFVAIVGSAVFNVLFVIAVCAIASPEVLPLTWWPLARDCTFYVISLLTVAFVFSVHSPNKIDWWEAILLLLEYIGYCTFMKFNGRVNQYVEDRIARRLRSSKVAPQETHSGTAADEESKFDYRGSNNQHSLAKPNTFRLGIVQLLTRNSYIYETAGIAAVTQLKGGIKETFDKLDIDASGKLDVEEIKPLLASLGCKCDNASIKTALRRINRNGDDQISFENFSKWYISSEARIEAEIHRVFDSFDRNNDGVIDSQEIKQCLRSLGHKPTDDEVEGVLQELMHKQNGSPASTNGPGNGATDLKLRETANTTELEVTPVEAFSTGGQGSAINLEQFEEWYKTSLFFRNHQELLNHEVEAAEDGYLTLDYPEGNDGEGPSWSALFWYVFSYPICAVLFVTLPDVRHPRLQRNWKMAVLEFALSLVWIGVFSLWLYECLVVVSNTLKIPVAVSAVTLLAGGTSVPDLLSSYVVAKNKEGDMAVSSSIGSNIFDVTVGLPLPWLCYIISKGKSFDLGESGSKGLGFSILLLVAMLAAVIGTIVYMKWRMTKAMGYAMMVFYILYVTQYLLQKMPDDCDDSKDGVFQINF